MTTDPPDAVRVMDWVEDLLMETSPNGTLDAFTLRVPPEEVAPLRFTARFPAEELLAIVRSPVKGPPFTGVNDSVSDAVWPGFNVSGADTPEVEKSEPAIDSAEMVTGPVPLDFRVTVCVPTFPTATLPKLTLVELTLKVGLPGLN